MSWWGRNSPPRRMDEKVKSARPHLIARRSRLRRGLRRGLRQWHRRLCVLRRSHADGRHRPVQSSLFLAIGAQVDRAAALCAGTQVDRATARRALRHRAGAAFRRTAVDQTRLALSRRSSASSASMCADQQWHKPRCTRMGGARGRRGEVPAQQLGPPTLLMTA